MCILLKASRWYFVCSLKHSTLPSGLDEYDTLLSGDGSNQQLDEICSTADIHGKNKTNNSVSPSHLFDHQYVVHT